MKKFDLKLGDKECPRCQGSVEVRMKGKIYTDGTITGSMIEDHDLCHWSKWTTPIPYAVQIVIRERVFGWAALPKAKVAENLPKP